MLKELYIENLAVIEKADIVFTDKFNVFSGETGAGKSILIGAINAVLGGRVYKDIVRTGTAKASVSAVFDYIPERTARKLEENGFACEDELLVRRDISADGKSTVHINGAPATAAVLKEIMSGLIDIHGQHDNRILTDNANQRELIDGYAELKERLAAYGELFRTFSKLTRDIKRLEALDSEKSERIERLKADIDSVEKLRLKKGDETEISERLSALGIELDDIAGEISSALPDDEEENELPALEEKMSGILLLKRKYSAELDDIIDMCSQWKTELSELSETDDTITKLSEERHKLGDELKKAALEISDIRQSASERLTEQITEELKFLGMPDVRLRFDITRGKITVNGMDEVQLMISVNKGEELKPIAKAASGGELSRIMLAVKSVSAENDDTPTMIFDEIDTGISGIAAQKVGRKLSELSRKRQVLCVTHLAQIAALSDNHLLISKESRGERTYTSVKALDYDEKLKEIARIISGDSGSEASIRNAEELVSKRYSGDGE